VSADLVRGLSERMEAREWDGVAAQLDPVVLTRML
jgi:hypothetical protein